MEVAQKRLAMPRRKATYWRYLPPGVMRSLGQFDVDSYAAADVADTFRVAKLNHTHRRGLIATWEGIVWLNLPAYEEPAEWLSKLAEYGNGIALVRARTASEEWHRLVYGPPSVTGVFLFRGKPTIYRESGHAEPSRHELALVCYGSHALRRVQFAQGRGTIHGTLTARIGPVT